MLYTALILDCKKVSPNVTQNLSVCNVMRSYSQLYNCAMAFESLFALGICAQLHFPTSTTICFGNCVCLLYWKPITKQSVSFSTFTDFLPLQRMSNLEIP